MSQLITMKHYILNNSVLDLLYNYKELTLILQ